MSVTALLGGLMGKTEQGVLFIKTLRIGTCQLKEELLILLPREVVYVVGLLTLSWNYNSGEQHGGFVKNLTPAWMYVNRFTIEKRMLSLLWEGSMN
jgi:hypothetical protein